MNLHGHKLSVRIFATTLSLIVVMATWNACPAHGALGAGGIRLVGLSVDVDLRPDLDGLQTEATLVRDFPSAFRAVVGPPGEAVYPGVPSGWRVKAQLRRSASGDAPVALSAPPNEMMEIPPPKVAGDYLLERIRLEDGRGNILMERDPTLAPLAVEVIDKLLVSKVKTRPLTLEEIQEKGIVIDEDNFSAMNFTVGLTVGSEQVEIDLPMVIPKKSGGVARLPRPSSNFQFEPMRYADVKIPNLQLVGFSMLAAEEPEEAEFKLPPINGVIVIPGNIAFLNQFFSVILQTANVAPEGSGLRMQHALARIALPAGRDGMAGTGDDPLRVAETQDGVAEELPLLDDAGSDTIVPQGTNQNEFLVEGLKEGTHTVTFDISGEFFSPALGRTVPMSGKAAGAVQVKNPTFSLVLAHPDTVREGEVYSLFATATNTSTSPANLFRINLNTRSLSGALPAEGETGVKELESLPPGEAETFEFRLRARTTGKVTGTVFLADEAVNGSFILNTGVGDTGIPLSPDTLILPRTVEYLPDSPDLVFPAVRLLGQAYSVATAPAGTLPPEIRRISKSFVFDRAVKLAQAGLHSRFGEAPAATVEDILLDYFGNDVNRLEDLYARENERSAVETDLHAFDRLRRTTEAGASVSDALAAHIGRVIREQSLSDFQAQWAGRFASRPGFLSVGVESTETTAVLEMVDADGNTLGALSEAEAPERDIPFADLLRPTPETLLMVAAAPVSPTYTCRFRFPAADPSAAVSLVVPGPEGMVHVAFPPTAFPAGGSGVIALQYGQTDGFLIALDDDGDGVPDDDLAPADVRVVPDAPPEIIGALQWAKGNRPTTDMDLGAGDPLGRMVGVLFSEEVTRDSAEAPSHYRVPDHDAAQVVLQPDRRMVFMMLGQPVGPFVERSLMVSDIADMRGKVMDGDAAPIGGDPERGLAGVVSGIVQGPDGAVIPFAQVRYFQPVHCPRCEYIGWTRDYEIATATADASGRYQIDFVLQNALRSETPDIWLNDRHAGGTANFKLEAADPATGNIGRASTRIRFDGQWMNLNVIIRGYGGIEGRVYDEYGEVVVGGSPGFLAVHAKNLSTGEAFASWVDETGYYAFPRELFGGGHTAPQLTVGNILLRIFRPSDLFTGVVAANIPAAGATVVQDIVLVDPYTYGTVSGRVLEGDGAAGAPDVRVWLEARYLASVGAYSREYKTGVVNSTVTDESGFFRFENVPAGDIAVHAVRQATYEKAQARSYLAEQEEKHLTLVLPGSGGGVRGYVKDALGDLVPGAKVACGPFMTETDETGGFEITGLPIGAFKLYAQAPDSLATGIVDLDIDAPGKVFEVIATLQPVGTIEGDVTDADGAPAAGQKVQLWVGDKGIRAHTFTDENGRYRFRDYPVGRYCVRAVRSDRGDGGMAVTEIRYPGDRREADIRFRGMGEILGRVIQGNGTPIVSDVIITRKVWRIIPAKTGADNNYYLDFAKEIQKQVDEETAAAIDEILEETGAAAPPDVFFMLVDEPVHISSDILGPNGEVTGRFHFPGPAAGGPFTATAFGPFLAPSEKTGEIPRTDDPAERIVDVGDIVLSPTTGSVRGRVTMPDGQTPVGEGVKVSIQSLDSSGTVRIPGNYGGSVQQPVLPSYDVITDADGRFHFPLVLRGRFILTADTGAPETPAGSPGEMIIDWFSDDDGERALNVRLYGRTAGVVRAGGELAADIQLRSVSGVRATVVHNDERTPAIQAAVELKTDSPLDEDEAADGLLSGNTDAAGMIEFFPVIEGDFSLSAVWTDGAASVKGRTGGSVPPGIDNDGFIEAKVVLGAVTTETGEVIQADIFGTVAGTVYKADGAVLENPAQVRIESAGVVILTTSGPDGRYTAENVPGGDIRVKVFEPFTARRGGGSGRIESDGQAIDIPVTLVGLGIVAGHVTDAAGTIPITEADVTLFPSGRFTDPLISRTDGTGAYRLPGVPLGDYSVEAVDYDSGLSGAAEGAMVHDGDVSTTDVRLQASGTVEGTLFAATDPTLGVVNAAVAIKGNGVVREAITDADGWFTSGPHLPAGAYSITARPAGGVRDGASAAVDITYDGEIVGVDLVLAGTGAVGGTLLDSGCQAPFADQPVMLTLFSNSPYSDGAMSVSTGLTGAFRFEGVPLGDFTISAAPFDETRRGGAASGTLAAADEHVILEGDAALCLEDAGGIRAVVTLADGAPVEGAIVRLTKDAVRMTRLTGPDGSFSFNGLPVGIYRLSILDPITGGVAERSSSVTAEEETDLGTILLDSDRPAVVSTTPEPDATDVSTGQIVAVIFSEPVDPSTVTAATVRVSVAGEPVGGSLSVDGEVVEWAPNDLFPDLSRVDIRIKGEKTDFQGQVIETGIQDPAGLGLAGDCRFTFTTGDNTPPALVSVSPADHAVEVDPQSVVRFEFSEPVRAESVDGFTLTADGVEHPCRMNAAPILGGQVIVFTPETPLSTDARYTARLTGAVRDTAGNAMDQDEIVIRFSTPDTVAPGAPVLEADPSVPLICGNTVDITAAVDLVDTHRLEFFIDNELVHTDDAFPYIYALYLDPALGPSASVSVVAVDPAGNRSQPGVIDLTIAENRPPTVAVAQPPSGEANHGEAVAVRVEAEDDAGLAAVALTVNGGDLFSAQQAVDGTAAVMTAQFDVPDTLPAGSILRLIASATDASGKTTVSEPVLLTVRDTLGPGIAILSPANHSLENPGAAVQVAVRADDITGVTEIRLHASYDGAAVEVDGGGVRSFDPALNPASAEFGFMLPIPDDIPSPPVIVTATAADAAGNTATSDLIVLRIADPFHVKAATPKDGAVDVPVGAAVTIDFSEPVDPASVTGGTFTVSTIEGPLNGTLVFTRNNERLTWLPTDAVHQAFDAPCTVSLTDGILGEAGGSPLKPFTAAFRTTDLAIIDPRPGDDLETGQTVVLRADGADASTIRALAYSAAGAPIGVGAAPAPFDHAWPMPADTPEGPLSLGGEAVIGGGNAARTAAVSGSGTLSIFGPDRAADGDVDPDFSGGGVAAMAGAPAWWQADLDRLMIIDRIVVHLHDRCCAENNHIRVLVAAEPFLPGDFSGDAPPEVFSNHAVEVYRTQEGPDGGVLEITGPFAGRYIRVVQAEGDFLALPEVEVYERQFRVPATPVEVSVAPAVNP